ncbi:MAG: 50S ribosomal protein L5 [Candidatus Sungbacteria bacterium]|nr:50S ribosomal protein L5 [Candidatus Sungbacteria bacterium]
MSISLHEKYKKEIIPALMKELKKETPMAVPRIKKVVVNVGVGRIRDEKIHEQVRGVLSLVTGQKPSPRPARVAISSFKTRKGLIIGYTATLRRRRMYDFLERLINATLPRTRDFRGLEEKSFDQKGNLTLGVKEHIVFPEMAAEDVRHIFGLEITVVTTARKRAEGIALLRMMGFPIK